MQRLAEQDQYVAAVLEAAVRRYWTLQMLKWKGLGHREQMNLDDQRAAYSGALDAAALVLHVASGADEHQARSAAGEFVTGLCGPVNAPSWAGGEPPVVFRP